MSFLEELRGYKKIWDRGQAGLFIDAVKEQMRTAAKKGKEHVVISGEYTMPENEDICYWILNIDGKPIGNYSKWQAVELFKALQKFLDENNIRFFLLTEDRYKIHYTSEHWSDLFKDLRNADDDCDDGDELGDHVITWGSVM